MWATVAVILWTVMEKTHTNRSKAWISNERVGEDLICGTLQSSHIWSIQFFCLQLLHIALLKLENTGVFFSLTLLIWVLTCFNVPKHFFFCFLMSISACLFKGLLSKSPVRSDWSARTGMSRCFSSASVFLQPRQVGRDCVVLKSQP